MCLESKEGVATPPACRATNMPLPLGSTETLRMTGNPLPEAPRGRLSREHSMKRRQFLKDAAVVPLLSSANLLELADAQARDEGRRKVASRVRPGDAGWPSEEGWNKLRQLVGGRLVKVESPVSA